MIIARIKGGIGNQLFIYCAAKRLALFNNTELVLDNVSGFVHDPYNRHYQLDYFNISCKKAINSDRLEPFSRIRRYLKRYLNSYKPFSQRSYLQQEGMDFDSRILNFRTNKKVFFEGYWQSENYFKDIESVIREDLQILPPEDNNNKIMVQKIQNNNSIAIHIRYFDNEMNKTNNIKNFNNAPFEYYKKAIIYCDKKIPNAHYFIFSDQPKNINKLPLDKERFTIVDINQKKDKSYADLWLMSHCKHFIIANSTFSWWGAWLSSNINKIIIAPGFIKNEGKMKWGFDGLIPSDWIKI